MSSSSQDQPRQPPGGLDLVRGFVNTLDLETGDEALGTVRALSEWLSQHGFRGTSDLGSEDLKRTIALREALRTLLLANGGEPLDPGAVRELKEAADRCTLRPIVEDGGRVSLVPSASGVDALCARLLQTMARSQAEGTWSRLKACPAERCGWAFYDESRNRSRSWCSMEICGNRAKTRRYRRRREGPATQ